MTTTQQVSGIPMHYYEPGAHPRDSDGRRLSNQISELVDGARFLGQHAPLASPADAISVVLYATVRCLGACDDTSIGVTTPSRAEAVTLLRAEGWAPARVNGAVGWLCPQCVAAVVGWHRLQAARPPSRRSRIRLAIEPWPADCEATA